MVDMTGMLSPPTYRTIRFTAYGKPATAGSKIGHTLTRKDGSIVTLPNGKPLVVSRDSSGAKGKSWRGVVQDAARQAYQGELLRGPLRLAVTFVRPRPKGHFGKHALRSWAPAYDTSRPDCTKLLRAVEDALNGLLWKDDSQVVTQAVEKTWGEPACAIITVEELEPT